MRGPWILALALGVAGRSPAQPQATPADKTSTPLTLAIAVDETATTERDINRSRELITSLVGALPKGSEFTVASFSGEKRIVLPPTTDLVGLASTMADFKAGRTGVALADGLFDIIQYLAARDSRASAVLVISAGRTGDGDLNFDDPLDLAAKKRIPVFTLGLGQGDGRMLRRIAKLTGGEYVRMEVADGAILAHAMAAAMASKDAPASASVAESSAHTTSSDAEAMPRSGISGGLLGAAAVFFAVGGVLMVGIVILLVRRLSAPPAPASAAGPANADPPNQPARPVRPVRPVPPVLPAESAPRSPPDAATIMDDPADVTLERTLVVNAAPILQALSGPGAGKSFPLSPTGRTSLGRSRSNDILVPEDAASAQHCRIDREGDSYVLYDLGSTNGTWVNGAKVDRVLLQHGDRLTIGGTGFTVSLFGDRT